MLCTNRPEGFGPHSPLSHPLPTTCFTDTVLIPLPIWLAFLLLPTLYLFSLRRRRHRRRPAAPADDDVPLLPPRRRTRLHKALMLIHVLLLIAQLLMLILEIVRLALLDYGVALLPFTLLGPLLALALYTTQTRDHLPAPWHLHGWRAVNALIYIGGAVMEAVKIAGLARQPRAVRDLRRGSKYPWLDQVTDLVVVIAVYLILLATEMGLWAWESRRSRDGNARAAIGMGDGSDDVAAAHDAEKANIGLINGGEDKGDVIAHHDPVAGTAASTTKGDLDRARW